MYNTVIWLTMACSVGSYLNESCENNSYGLSVISLASEFSDSDRVLVQKRVGLDEINSVCTYHYKKYVHKFSHLFGQSCSDPFSFHKKVITKNLRVITLCMSEKWPSLSLVPGKSVCSSCHKRLAVHNTEDNTEDDLDQPFTDPDIVIETLNQVGETLGVSPIKIKRLSNEKKHLEVKRTVKKFSGVVKEKLSNSFNLDVDVLEEEDGNRKTTNIAVKDIEYLSQCVKERIKYCTSNAEKIKVISVVPHSWTIRKTVEELGVSEYLVKKTIKIVEKHGIIPEVNLQKIGRKTSQEIKNLVVKFYEGEDVSRMCPGMKETKSVRLDNGVKELKQKRLILCNLKELYEQFKQEHPLANVGFSSFCALRPQWCILAGASGTHTVCVCCIHQNVKLMAAAVGLSDCKSLLSTIVCDINNENCMIGQCSQCPGVDALDFNELCHEIRDDDDDENTISYRQWVSTDRCKLVTILEPFSEFKEHFAMKLRDLKSHHFIAKSQSQFLKDTKLNLPQNECVVIADFSENYTFVLQDEIQSYHWVNVQATVHPFCVYFKKESGEDTCHRSLCVISDCMEHTTTAVYAFQKQLVLFIKSFIPNLKKILYFSDGCAGHYKNRKNFSNLCKHYDDFGVHAEWHFFATSHGKGPSDGIGGTVKRLVTKASLQRPSEGHINTHKAMFDFCVQNIKGIDFVLVTADDVQKEHETLKHRFEEAKTFDGTRDHHCYIPLDRSTLRISKISASVCSKYIEFKTDRTSHLSSIKDINKNDYVVCVYDKKWFIGKVIDVSEANDDAKVVFFKPAGPTTTFSKTSNDIVWVKSANIIDILSPLDFTTATGRTYNISQEKSTELCHKLNFFLKSVKAVHSL